MKGQSLSLYVVSDSTGETAISLTQAALVHFQNQEVQIIRIRHLKQTEQIDRLVDDIKAHSGLVVFTIVAQDLKKHLVEQCSVNKIPVVDLLGPLLFALDQFFEVTLNGSQRQVGLLRTVDERYFRRVEAIEFTVKHDDGKELRDLENADIVLVGISRTSKTPLSVFLSHKGWKAANIPIVLGMDLPDELLKVDPRKIIALTIDPQKLTAIRKKRAEKLGVHQTDYASLKHINEEVEYALKIFEKNRRWPVIDVTERALEETAAEIIRLVCARLGRKEDPLM